MIVDDNGKKEILTSKTVMSMLQIGWGAFFLGWIINTSFYVVNREAVFLKHNLKVITMLYKIFYTCRYTHRQLILSLADLGKDSPSLFLDRRDRFYSVVCRGVFMGRVFS